MTRTKVTGRKHLKIRGPVIYAGNHTSTLDALLFIALLPAETTFVGPGDFKLMWPANWVIKLAGVIPMKRGSVDREGLRHLRDVLAQQGRLAMFPEGGTWEKPINDVKPGAAYLSHAAEAWIVPVGIGGTYQAWQKIARFRRPKVQVTIGQPLAPIMVSKDRKRRQHELEVASIDLMRHIYDLLPPDTRAYYDRMARLTFRGALTFRPDTVTPPDVSLDALAELISKPNLFSPLHRNARLPLVPFVNHSRFYPAATMKVAVTALFDAFAAGDYSEYLEYRLGNVKAAKVRAALEAISAVMDGAAAAGAQVCFTPTVIEAPSDALY
ncbi:MAG: 1-acyl-sn-glycerol-3-phosphate acyltransferase [Anaerolineae bacterium]|nr:1-acyl-sn-glycerol-3-phosphate acyltransferase [Anaerolineae bacterium]